MKPYSTHRTVLRRRTNAGYIVLTFALSALVIIGMVGVSVDVGRAYIAKSEGQVFSDSAALSAALELDGTPAGLARARAQVAANTNKWNFNTSSFGTVTTSFSQSISGPWEENPASAAGYLYAKASTSANVPVFFMGMFRNAQHGSAPSSFTTPVNTAAVAGQELKTTFSEGLFPFSPLAHNGTGPTYGLTPALPGPPQTEGGIYTFRWAANPKLTGNNPNVCQDDRTQSMIDLAQSGNGSERGYIEDTSASVIRQAIGGDAQTVTRSIGDTVNMTGGAKGTERTAIANRIASDTNSTAATYWDYVNSGTGNGQRIVAMPINSGAPNYTIVQIGAFFLLPANNYSQSGNTAWCAEYIGAYVQGGKAGVTGTSAAGAYVVRLVQ